MDPVNFVDECNFASLTLKPFFFKFLFRTNDHIIWFVFSPNYTNKKFLVRNLWNLLNQLYDNLI